MSGSGRFLFDECVGKPVMEQLHQMVPTEAEFVHICDYFKQGVKDREWVPRIAAEGGWVVITSDGGKQSKRGEKLPNICLEFGVTHVVLSTVLHTKKSHEKAAAIASMWGQIEPLHKEEPGTRYKLRYKETRGKIGLMIVLERVVTTPLSGSEGTTGKPGNPPDKGPGLKKPLADG